MSFNEGSDLSFVLISQTVEFRQAKPEATKKVKWFLSQSDHRPHKNSMTSNHFCI